MFVRARRGRGLVRAGLFGGHIVFLLALWLSTLLVDVGAPLTQLGEPGTEPAEPPWALEMWPVS